MMKKKIFTNILQFKVIVLTDLLRFLLNECKCVFYRFHYDGDDNII